MKIHNILLLCFLLSGSVLSPEPVDAAPLPPPLAVVAQPPVTLSSGWPAVRLVPDRAISPDEHLVSMQKIKRVLVISFDGMRTDAIEAAPMNNLLGLMDTGSYTLSNAITIAYPSTLPSHAAMLSGLCMGENGVIYDRYFKYRGYSKGVDIFDLAHAANMRTVMIVGKAKLRQLAEPETTDIFEVHYDEASIGEAAVEQISQDFGLMFVHFPSADQVGHRYGWMGGSYLQMLRNGDDALGEMLAALDENGLRDSTLIIVTADHGGHKKNHIGTVIEDFRIPWIASGSGIVPGEITALLHTMDTAATVAYALRLPLQPDWAGIPVYEAFGETRTRTHPEDVQWPCHLWN